MREEILTISDQPANREKLPVTWVHTLVIGSGASGLNAAVQLHANGVKDVLIITEGLQMGTSINTGSDKQTYYKLSMCGDDTDSPGVMAQTYFAGGSMHGDLALVEASLSARAFFHLTNLGVPFPRDTYGQFVGYKTDYDPRQRATSIGPYTSREMCRALIHEVEQLGIEVREQTNVVQLLTVGDDDNLRIAGALAVRGDGTLEAYGAENVIFAVGGPGGLYKTSVYPAVHTGAVGLALIAGAKAQNLPESQYGMASTKFRWNVSGTYMQVIPRFISTAADGVSDEQEFMPAYFDSAGALNSQVFLKGYQWPFDSRKAIGGSSLIDILVHIETVLKHRRVFLDFRRNPEGFRFDDLSQEAIAYLNKSEALLDSPIERLRKMNPAAIALYREHDIDIAEEPLEIAVCAQHNNGGLAGNLWWESTNIGHLFPIGEVNGSHGVNRPGGSALNAGQVGAFRAAEFIAHRYPDWDLAQDTVKHAVISAAGETLAWTQRSAEAPSSWQAERNELQERMTRAGAHIRSPEEVRRAVSEARKQWRRIEQSSCSYSGRANIAEALRTRYLCFAHLVYLEAISFALQSRVGSRGSAIVIDREGAPIHDSLGEEWCIVPEDPNFRDKVLETVARANAKVESEWVDRRPIPATDSWFETVWARFRSGEIFE